jgi:hypothetical protein
MASEAASVRSDTEASLLQVSLAQARMAKAQKEVDRARDAYGEGSNDYAFALGEQERVRTEAEALIVDQLGKAESRLAVAEQRTGTQVASLVAQPKGFQSLVRGYLSGQSGAESTAILLHVALRKLHGRCSEMQTKALVGQIETGLDGLEKTLELLQQLSPGVGGRSSSLDEAADELFGTGATAGDVAVDDLDRLLSQP